MWEASHAFHNYKFKLLIIRAAPSDSWQSFLYALTFLHKVRSNRYSTMNHGGNG